MRVINNYNIMRTKKKKTIRISYPFRVCAGVGCIKFKINYYYYKTDAGVVRIDNNDYFFYLYIQKYSAVDVIIKFWFLVAP